MTTKSIKYVKKVYKRNKDLQSCSICYRFANILMQCRFLNFALCPKRRAPWWGEWSVICGVFDYPQMNQFYLWGFIRIISFLPVCPKGDNEPLITYVLYWLKCVHGWVRNMDLYLLGANKCFKLGILKKNYLVLWLSIITARDCGFRSMLKNTSVFQFHLKVVFCLLYLWISKYLWLYCT